PGDGGPAPEQAGPSDGDTGGGRPPGGDGRRPRRGRRVLQWSAAVLALLITGSAGAGYLYYRHLNDNLKKDTLNLGDNKVAAPTPDPAGRPPLNIRLTGSDAGDTEENHRLGGAREAVGSTPLADAQMLAHLSADRSKMSVASMPRDTLVKIPKCTDPDDGTVYPASNG